MRRRNDEKGADTAKLESCLTELGYNNDLEVPIADQAEQIETLKKDTQLANGNLESAKKVAPPRT